MRVLMIHERCRCRGGEDAAVLFGVHVLFDLSPRIPGFAVIWVSILGVAVARSYSSAAERLQAPAVPE